MNRIILILGLFAASISHAQRVPIADLPKPATNVYTILALPANYATDSLSQNLLSGFNKETELRELRQNSNLFTYSESDPDWRGRWQSRVPILPAVLVMKGDEVLYKKSGATAETVALGMREGRILDRIRDRPKRPRPDCPDDKCPVVPDDKPLPNDDAIIPEIPDTDIDIPDTGTPPVTVPIPGVPDAPSQDIDLTALIAKISALETRVAELESRKPKDGVDGRNGKDGKDGLTGPPGPAGKDGQPTTIDYSQIIARLPPFWIRVVDPRGKYTTEPQKVHLGQQVDIKLEPIVSGGQP